MKLLTIFTLIILINIIFVSALCEEGQIDINSASLGELKTFTGVGDVRAQAIIDYREEKEFDSVDELIEVYGIGEVTLENMIKEGACVDDDNSEDEESEEDEEEEEFMGEIPAEKAEESNESEEIKVINLTTQIIKSPEDTENQGNYAMYGLVAFCVLLGLLFIIRNKKYKNEFR